jgi:aminopeptidase N
MGKLILHQFGFQIGYPVLTVKEEGGKLHIRQDRFLATGDPTEEENQTVWYVNVSCCIMRKRLTEDINSGISL